MRRNGQKNSTGKRSFLAWLRLQIIISAKGSGKSHNLPESIYLSIDLSVGLSFYPSIYLSVCLSVCLSFYLSIKLSIYLSVCLSIYLSLCLSVCLSICLSICLSVYLSICLSVYLSICLSIYLSICLSIYLSRDTHTHTYIYTQKILHIIYQQQVGVDDSMPQHAHAIEEMWAFRVQALHWAPLFGFAMQERSTRIHIFM